MKFNKLKLFIVYIVDSNRVHINKADGSTWVNCDSECPIPSLVCMTPSPGCMEEGIMQVCDEMIQEVHVARWCVYQYNGKASHRQCTQSCQDDSSVKSMLKDYSGSASRYLEKDNNFTHSFCRRPPLLRRIRNRMFCLHVLLPGSVCVSHLLHHSYWRHVLQIKKQKCNFRHKLTI